MYFAVPLTIADVAEAAGVSVATVDRALNGRAGVHARTRSRVMRAAQRIGYVEPRPEAPQRQAADIRLAFVVPGGTNTFLANLSRSLETAAKAVPYVRLSLHRLDTYRPEMVAEGLRTVSAMADGIGVIALDHPAVREAIRDLAAAGKQVLTLVSDISDVPRRAYVGIDNRAAGRLAGHLMGRFLRRAEGEVALFAGSLRYRGHEEREMGFRRICAEDFPGLHPLPTIEIEDDAARSYVAADALLARHPALVGAYCIGGGVRGIAQALEERGRAGRLVFIGHELTEHTRRFLVSGTMDAVIDQDPAAEARRAVELLAGAVRGEPMPASPMLRTQAVFRENIPDNRAMHEKTGGEP
jgi:LacI family transcriptional regulator